jgi:hypothetical protein
MSSEMCRAQLAVPDFGATFTCELDGGHGDDFQHCETRHATDGNGRDITITVSWDVV